MPAFGMIWGGVETRWFMGNMVTDFSELQLGGGNSHFLLFLPRNVLGKMNPFFFRAYFSNGLVKPPTSSCMFYKFLVVF